MQYALRDGGTSVSDVRVFHSGIVAGVAWHCDVGCAVRRTFIEMCTLAPPPNLVIFPERRQIYITVEFIEFIIIPRPPLLMASAAWPWQYTDKAVGKEESGVLYDAFKALVDPEPNSVFVYGKWHVEKRLTGTYTRDIPASFTYSNNTRRTDGSWPLVLDYIAAIAAAHAPARADGSCVRAKDFDLVHINHYRDGSDALSWHSDKDGMDESIASFSFYDPSAPPQLRDFHIRSKALFTDTHKVSLGQGCLLLMHPKMQARYEHSVPERKRVTRGRVNCTLRQHHLLQKHTASHTHTHTQ